MESEELIYQFERSLLSLDKLAATRIVKESSYELPPLELLDMIVAPALQHIGEGWEQGKIALSQVYMSGRICSEIVDDILPLSDETRRESPKTAIAVLEDYHLLGKRVVYAVLRASGYDLIDYGHGIKADDLVRHVVNDGVEVLLISILMLNSALRVKNVREKLDDAGKEIKIIVGGAPFLFDEELWEEVGADAMGHYASEAPELLRKVIEEEI